MSILSFEDLRKFFGSDSKIPIRSFHQNSSDLTKEQKNKKKKKNRMFNEARKHSKGKK